MIITHFRPLFAWRLGALVHLVIDARLARHLSADPDPVPPPDGDPPPPPEDPEPVPLPDPEPIPPPDDPDPIPPPEPDDYKHDRPYFTGVLVLGTAKAALSGAGEGWWRIEDKHLDQWQPQSERHLEAYLERTATHQRACFHLDISPSSPWWELASALTRRHRGLILVQP